MTTATPSTALATIQPAFTYAERLALAGFLAGYRGLTREAYALDLRQFTTWCRCRSLALFAVRRADIEGFARELEARGRARATITRRLCTIAGFYKYAVEEELLDHSPAAHSAVRGWTTMLQAAQHSQLKRRSGHTITLRHEGSVTPAI
jgi:integrase/recombinase XerD